MANLEKYLRAIFVIASFVLIFQLIFVEFLYLLSKLTTLKAREDWSKSLHDLVVENDHLKIFNHSRNKNDHLILFVAVLNRLTLYSRREAIRSTWMSECSRPHVACKFFTDPVDSVSGANLTRVKDEMGKHKDMISMPYKGMCVFLSSRPGAS